MSTAPPTKTPLSQGLAEVGPSGLFVQRLENKQAALLAQSGCLLSRPPSAAPPRRVEVGGAAGMDSGSCQMCGGFPAGKLQGGLRHPGEGTPTAGQQCRSSQRLLDYHLLAALGQEVPAGEKAPRRGFAH